MPRKRPAQIRALPPRRRRGVSIPQVPRVSAATLRAIAALERTRLRPGAIAEAVAGWAKFVHGPDVNNYVPEDCTCQGCQWDDPVVRRSALRMTLFALPTKAARELRAVIRPLDEHYLARALPDPDTAHILYLLTIPPARPRFNPLPENKFTFAVDLVYVGWLLVLVGDGRREQRLYASYLTPALDDLLASLVALTRGEKRAQVSWEGEPTEYRWLITIDPYAHAHVRILRFGDGSEQLPAASSHNLLNIDLPLRTLVRSISVAARALLTRLGEERYARQWDAGPFPTTDLLTLEQWLRDNEPVASSPTVTPGGDPRQPRQPAR